MYGCTDKFRTDFTKHMQAGLDINSWYKSTEFQDSAHNVTPASKEQVSTTSRHAYRQPD